MLTELNSDSDCQERLAFLPNSMKNNISNLNLKNIIVLGSIELKNNSCYINGKPTKNPEKIGVALLDFAETSGKPVEFNTLKSILKDYLELNNHRLTSERIFILKTIHEINSPFNVEDLFFIIQDTKIRVTKATIYNTLKLFVKANIISKSFSKNNNEAFSSRYFELISS